ncbi:polysaccharide deacetylase family protein [Aquiflexum lacus]|uniref:polysaccharide deacetylase family protein n=1 Tax=Aquiflexum lacus TaxID=2483805 RepID=UPI001895ACDD|nr:polysaccharide deacetylase family protein [Aquiflexum lacus]
MEEILLLLQKHFYMVSAKDLENYYYEGLSIKNACHITVDDGDISVYSYLFPLIKKYKIPISIYVSPYAVETGKNFWFQEIKNFDMKQLLNFLAVQKGEEIPFVGDHQVYAILKSMKVKEINSLIEAYKRAFNIPDGERVGMNLDQLMELKASGLVSIGAHTLHHPILKNENDDITRKEILQSVQDLGDLLHEEIKYFAYPNGLPGLDFGEREINLLKEAKIRLAFSTESRHFSLRDNPLSIPRRGVTKGGSTFVLAKLAFGDYWENMKKLLKGKQEKDFRYQ